MWFEKTTQHYTKTRLHDIRVRLREKGKIVSHGELLLATFLLSFFIKFPMDLSTWHPTINDLHVGHRAAIAACASMHIFFLFRVNKYLQHLHPPFGHRHPSLLLMMSKLESRCITPLLVPPLSNACNPRALQKFTCDVVFDETHHSASLTQTHLYATLLLVCINELSRISCYPHAQPTQNAATTTTRKDLFR